MLETLLCPNSSIDCAIGLDRDARVTMEVRQRSPSKPDIPKRNANPTRADEEVTVWLRKWGLHAGSGIVGKDTTVARSLFLDGSQVGSLETLYSIL
jgi:hypothetical protein